MLRNVRASGPAEAVVHRGKDQAALEVVPEDDEDEDDLDDEDDEDDESEDLVSVFLSEPLDPLEPLELPEAAGVPDDAAERLSVR
jgi:hypothetical protein